MFGVTLKAAKSQFFDWNKLRHLTGKSVEKNMSAFGALAMTIARRSIRYGKKPSAPGKPPTGHKTGRKLKKGKMQPVSLLRENILFFATRNGVIIGPVKLSNKSGDALPELEQGGASQIKTSKGVKKIQVKARPFMVPALAVTQSKLPSMWRNSIKE